MGEQEGWSGHTKTISNSPAPKGTDRVTGKVRQTSSVPRNPPSSAATSVCRRPFVPTTQNTAEGQVEPGARQHTICSTNTREQRHWIPPAADSSNPTPLSGVKEKRS